MAKNSIFSTTVPDSVWLGRGRHVGPEPERDVRRNLIAVRAAGVIDDFLELDPVEAAASSVLYPRGEEADAGPLARRLFEARWRAGGVVVRAQLTLFGPEGRRREGEGVGWVLAAEAEGVWQEGWVSPATVFWPDSDQVAWDLDVVAGVRLRSANALPKDDDALRRRVRECVRDSWFVHVVVHEAMTPGVAGRRPVSVFLPSGLRHRVVEHRATPEQAQIADFALKRELGVRLPRGGAVVLPSVGVEGDPGRFVVRSVFLDGSEPVELVERVREFARLPRGLGEEASVALGRLRRGWHLLTEQEELVHARAMVERYAQALEAMTDSRDRYREAAEAAHAALAEAGGGEGAPLLGGPKPLRTEASPLGALTKALGRLRPPNK